MQGDTVDMMPPYTLTVAFQSSTCIGPDRTFSIVVLPRYLSMESSSPRGTFSRNYIDSSMSMRYGLILRCLHRACACTNGTKFSAPKICSESAAGSRKAMYQIPNHVVPVLGLGILFSKAPLFCLLIRTGEVYVNVDEGEVGLV